MRGVHLPALAITLIAVAFITSACLFGGDDGDSSPTPEPGPTATPEAAVSGPEQALAAYAQTTYQKAFVPDCSRADVAQDTGKICAAFRGERGPQRAYVIGNTFSEFLEWVIVEDRNGTWSVVHNQKLNADNAGVPGIPWPLRTNVDVVVTGTGNGLNVREGPGLSQAAVDRIDDGTVIRLAAGPTNADNFQWWQVLGRTGWVVGDYLRFPDASQ